MSDDAKKPFNLNMHTARLLMREPFFAALSRRIDKTASKSVPTAGVRVNPHTAQFELLYNPDFMGQLKPEHQLGVLMHEFYHIILEHVTGRKPTDGLQRIDNIAMDLAINGLPEMSGKLPCEADPGPIMHDGQGMKGVHLLIYPLVNLTSGILPLLKICKIRMRMSQMRVKVRASPVRAMGRAQVIHSVALIVSTRTMSLERAMRPLKRLPRSD